MTTRPADHTRIESGTEMARAKCHSKMPHENCFENNTPDNCSAAVGWLWRRRIPDATAESDSGHSVRHTVAWVVYGDHRTASNRDSERVHGQSREGCRRRHDRLDIAGNARARIRVFLKRFLNQFGYPPDLQAEATKLVLEQAEALSAEWAA